MALIVNIYARAVACVVLFTIPCAAHANWFWPPALYYYGATVLWTIPAGLAAEFVILLPFIRMPPWPLFRVIVIANVISAIVGFVMTWPVVFWGPGVEAAADLALIGVFLVAALIFVLNIVIEYQVSVRVLGVAKHWRSRVGFSLANAASFAILVAGGFTLLNE